MPFIVSKPMEQLLTRNFEILDAFEKHIKTLHMQKDPRISVKESLLKRLEDLLVEVFISQFSLSLFFFFVFLLCFGLQIIMVPSFSKTSL